MSNDYTQRPELPQLTIKAIGLGIILSMVLAGANAYLGLFAGLTVSASIPAAVISMAVLRLFKDSNILENNIVQTAASAGESLAAGVIFTIPALILMGYWDSFDYKWVMLIAGLGGLLGVLFTIPLRRSLIVETKLAFPEGTATAEVLKVGDRAGTHSGIEFLVIGSLIGATVKFAETGLRIWSATAEGARYVGGGIAYLGANLSPALLSVGFIVGINIATLIFIGGAISWFIAIPIYHAMFSTTDPVLVQNAGADAITMAKTIWTTKIRYLGVGAMLIGGIWALVSMRSSLLSGIRSGLTQYKAGVQADVPHTDQDMPMHWVLIGIVLFLIPIWWLYQQVTGDLAVSVPMAIIMLVAGFLFSSVAAYMAGLVGSSNNPISGVTIATITMTALLLVLLMGQDSPNGAAAAIMVGAVVCCAAAIAGDNMQDLKAGYIVGATPWRQQVMQGVGVAASVLVITPILQLLLEAYGIGPATAEMPNSLAAPQANLMASVAQGVFGDGLPWGMVGLGVLLGVAVIITDEFLRSRNSTFRTPVLAVAVGVYLPLELSVSIFLGGVVAWIAGRISGERENGPARRHGILFAAGLITGEALIGIFLAIPIVLGINMALPERFQFGAIPGIVMLLVVMWAMSRAGSKNTKG